MQELVLVAVRVGVHLQPPRVRHGDEVRRRGQPVVPVRRHHRVLPRPDAHHVPPHVVQVLAGGDLVVRLVGVLGPHGHVVDEEDERRVREVGGADQRRRREGLDEDRLGAPRRRHVLAAVAVLLERRDELVLVLLLVRPLHVLVHEHGVLHLRVDPDHPLGVQRDVDELVERDDRRDACRKRDHFVCERCCFRTVQRGKERARRK